MAPGLAWMGKPAGFLKVIALVFDGLALGFLTHGIGFLQFAEYRMFFIVAGGYVIILTFRLIGFIFGGFETSPSQDAMADIAGAIILIILSSMMLSRINDIGVAMHGDRNLIIFSSVLSLLTGLLLGVDAIFVLKAQGASYATDEEGYHDRDRPVVAPKKQSKKEKKEKKSKKKKDLEQTPSMMSDIAIVGGSASKAKKKPSKESKKDKKGKGKKSTPSLESIPLAYSDEDLPPKKSQSKKGSKRKVSSAADIDADKPISGSAKSRHSAPAKSRSSARAALDDDEPITRAPKKFKQAPSPTASKTPTSHSQDRRLPQSRRRTPPETPSPEDYFDESD